MADGMYTEYRREEEDLFLYIGKTYFTSEGRTTICTSARKQEKEREKKD
jgi:hypothetical protein